MPLNITLGSVSLGDIADLNVKNVRIQQFKFHYEPVDVYVAWPGTLFAGSEWYFNVFIDHA